MSTQAPRDHWIPQSVLRGFESPESKQVPWWSARTRTFVRAASRRETAQMRGGNTVHLGSGRVVRTEDEWTALVDTPLGAALRELHAATWGSNDMALAARAALPALAASIYRPPTAAASRLDTTLRVNQILESVGSNGTRREFVDAIARSLGCSRFDAARVAPPLDEMRAIAANPHDADERALEDLVEGPLSMGRLARDQWLKAWPAEVTIARPGASAQFQLADCGLLIDDLEKGSPLLSAQIWEDVNDWREEASCKGPRGVGRSLSLRTAVSSACSLQIVFRGRMSGSDAGSYEFIECDDSRVRAWNDEQFDRSAQWVYGNP